MAEPVYGTKLNTNYFQLTDVPIDATSKPATNPFVRNAYNWLKGEGFQHMTCRVSNQKLDYAIDAYAEVELSNVLATITLRHTPADQAVDDV